MYYTYVLQSTKGGKWYTGFTGDLPYVRSHVVGNASFSPPLLPSRSRPKENPIGVAEYQLQTKLAAEFKGRLPTARQLTNAVRDVISAEK